MRDVRWLEPLAMGRHKGDRRWHYVHNRPECTAPYEEEEEMTAPRKARTPNIQSRVLREITQHPGEIVYADTIARDHNLTARQVANAVYNLRQRKDLEIEVIIQGSAWRWHPNATQPASDAPLIPSLAKEDLPVDIPTTRQGLVVTETKKPKREKRIFEEVGPTKSGLVVRDIEDDKLYILDEL